jgi:glycosyltransferase involved in cell wall biosynthesis
MKILQVCPRFFPYIGGIGEHVRNISEELARKYDVSVFTTDPFGKLPKQEIINGVKVRRFKSWAPNEAYYFSRALKKYLMENSGDYDVVHAHGYHAFPALYAAQAKDRNKLFFTPHYHGGGHTLFRNLLHIPYKFLGKSIFRKADKIICVSNYEKSLIVNHFKIDEKKVAVIPNGINLEEFKGLEKKRKDYRVILYVGRLEKYKRVQYLIETLPKLDHGIILEIVGKGPYKESLVKLARKLSVENRVKFYQDLPRKELLQKYADADLLVLLSKFEAYSITIAEALTAGTPCIVANTSALTEWIDNENCFGIDYPIDLEELAELIKEKIGKHMACVKSVKPQSWNQTVKSLINIYEKT